MDLKDFDFDLPEAAIALRPAEPRDHARLLIVHADGRLEDRHVYELPDILGPSHVMVFNDTRVLPAALKGVRPARNAEGQDVPIDVNLVEKLSDDGLWRALVRPGRRLRIDDKLVFAGGMQAHLIQRLEGGEVDLQFTLGGRELDAALEAVGAMPLPPYIARKRPADARDRTDYQPVIAGAEAASVAAPTASLHFTPHLIEEIKKQGVETHFVRLHVGRGTFAPLTDKQIDTKQLHEEWRHISTETASALNAARQSGKRRITVGTTAMRTLESAVDRTGQLHPVTGPTDIFIQPGDPILATDMLMTNFHLPRSSLFMLVCALMGTDIMQAAYAHGVAEGYRFYSYGDACLLVP